MQPSTQPAPSDFCSELRPHRTIQSAECLALDLTLPFARLYPFLVLWFLIHPHPFLPFFFSLIFVGFCLWTGIQSFLFLHLPNTLRLWWRLPVFTLEGMAPLPVSRSEDSIFRLVLWLLILEMLSSLYLCFWQLGSCFCVEL